jgi:hypothetical protein
MLNLVNNSIFEAFTKPFGSYLSLPCYLGKYLCWSYKIHYFSALSVHLPIIIVELISSCAVTAWDIIFLRNKLDIWNDIIRLKVPHLSRGTKYIGAICSSPCATHFISAVFLCARRPNVCVDVNFLSKFIANGVIQRNLIRARSALTIWSKHVKWAPSSWLPCNPLCEHVLAFNEYKLDAIS